MRTLLSILLHFKNNLASVKG